MVARPSRPGCRPFSFLFLSSLEACLPSEFEDLTFFLRTPLAIIYYISLSGPFGLFVFCWTDPIFATRQWLCHCCKATASGSPFLPPEGWLAGLTVPTGLRIYCLASSLCVGLWCALLTTLAAAGAALRRVELRFLRVSSFLYSTRHPKLNPQSVLFHTWLSCSVQVFLFWGEPSRLLFHLPAAASRVWKSVYRDAFQKLPGQIGRETFSLSTSGCARRFRPKIRHSTKTSPATVLW